MHATSDSPTPAFRSVMPSLPVAELDRALTFYTQALGFLPQFRNGSTFAIIVRDGVELSLMASGFSGVPAGSGRCYFRLSSGIDSLYAAYQATAVEVRHELRDEEYGMREFMIADVDGNEINFGQLISNQSNN